MSNTKIYRKRKNLSDEKRLNAELKLFYKNLFKKV